MSVYNGFSDFLDRNVSTHSSRAGVPTAKKGYVKGMRNIADQLSVRLATGNRIVTYLNEVKGCGFVDRLMNGENIAMPRFVWKAFVEQELQLEYTTRNRLRCWRALQLLIKCKTDGKYTKCAMLDGSKSCAKRNSGGKWNGCQNRTNSAGKTGRVSGGCLASASNHGLRSHDNTKGQR